MKFCPQPFTRIEVYENGYVYNCCPSFLYNYSIGNIYEEPFEEIWNSQKAIDLRKKMLNCDFSQCSDTCLRKFSTEEQILPSYKEYMSDYPIEVNVSCDNVCNVRCTICRDEFWQHPMPYEEFISTIDSKWMPMFKNAKYVRLGCSGEPFASQKEKALIKRINELYPSIKFEFHTNGILGDEKLLKELDVFDKIDTLTVSLHSRSEETYNKIVRGGNYKKMCKNLKLYSQMKKNGLINSFRMIFVVYSDNYHEAETFALWAKEHNAQAQFWAYRENDKTEIGKNYTKYMVTNPEHPDYKNLKDILRSDVFDSVVLYPELQKMRS